MSAIIAALGVKFLAYGATALAVLGGLFVAGRTIKNSGAADQRAADTQKGINDAAAATQARARVDSLGDAAVDDRLRGYQRK